MSDSSPAQQLHGLQSDCNLSARNSFHAIHLFDGLDTQRLQLQLGVCRVQPVPTGRALFSEGDPADWVVGIVAGRFKLGYVSSESPIIATLRNAGDMVGLEAVAARAEHCRSVVATQPSLVIRIRSEALLAWANIASEGWRHIARELRGCWLKLTGFS